MENRAPITTAEAGVILGVSAMTVRRRAESGDLPFIRKLPGPNGDYLFETEAVWAFAAKREQDKAAGQAKAAEATA